jgi:methyl-accepting chemotaxis protein
MFVKANGNKAILEALGRSQAMIEFDVNGNVLHANDLFLDTMDYTLDEIRGQHHSIFADPAYTASTEYQKFWETLRSGQFFSGEYQRFARDGKEIWIHASYNPVLGMNGKPVKIIKYASDITEQKLRNADYQGQINAISKSQAVIEFDMSGQILYANENFLNTMGYSAEEIIGQHHSIFADTGYAASPEYAHFWEQLNNGVFSCGEYQRFGKDGREVWLYASYNPILNMGGRPFKVVKYASDITQDKLSNANYQGQIDAISKSQAVIEFDMSGRILYANENFLNTMGYNAEEIIGQHHSMFADPAYAASPEYTHFWEQLNRGEYSTGEYQRFGKDNREVWIQASYNPILDMSGRPFKVMKYATDITPGVQTRKKAEVMTDQMQYNMQSVAAAAEQLSASISEISHNMNRSREEVSGIVEKTRKADELMTRLQTTAQSMESVTDLIRDIAGQVNLLALNATIEAARAGEAGKGFAVVAAEVKTLATQTGAAIDSISQEIQALQLISSDVAGSAGAISESTASVNEYVTSIASAIEEQTSVTQNISELIQQTSRTVDELNTTMQGIG